MILNLESFFAVLHQRLFNSYRRVTSVAVGQASGAGDDAETTAPDQSTNDIHDRTEHSLTAEDDTNA